MVDDLRRRGAARRGPAPAWTADDFYIGEATWHGRHIGRFLGIEPTGRTIVQPFVVVLSFRDGLMLGERFHYDLASLVRQIGADPIPALASCSIGGGLISREHGLQVPGRHRRRASR